MKEAMARRRKLNIRHRASDNEGIQSTSNNTNSTNVEGSNVAETRSSPCHAEGVIQVEPKRARGPTKMLDVWEMEHGDLIIVNLDKYGRPIGEEGTTLTRFIGSVARRYQYAPINYKSWKVMPNDYKEEMLKLIEKISKINRQNRAKFEDVHCMGSKSLPKFIDEKIKKGKGVLPGRKEIYIDTRTRKDGTIVNEKAARLIVPDATSAQNHLNSLSPNNNENNENGED
uniref:Uncharacterized protein LOC113786581 isoform X3 n=1 Tax=Cicer arietinum TaxID=3827 RepID=A0A3Q7XRM1_CICAR|nr:uncharacterized protein LOC113786581 isoform X3 [Cicer arietinum]